MRAVQRLFDIFQVPGTVHHQRLPIILAPRITAQPPPSALNTLSLQRAGQRRVPCTPRLTRLRWRICVPRSPLASLSIDAEGSDALILEGASRLLEARRIAVLEFEFIARGFWRSDKGPRPANPRAGARPPRGLRLPLLLAGGREGNSRRLRAPSGAMLSNSGCGATSSARTGDVARVFCRLAGLLPSGPSNTATSTTSMTTSACIRVA